jgi:hypothetical protein
MYRRRRLILISDLMSNHKGIKTDHITREIVSGYTQEEITWGHSVVRWDGIDEPTSFRV